jgi:hypothetical protein
MSTFKRFPAVINVFLAMGASFALSTAQAAPILSGSASFDAGTNLYTYQYTIDNTFGTTGIFAFALMVDSTRATPPSVAHTEPTNWSLAWGQPHQTIAAPPYSIAGTVFAWTTGQWNEILTGNVLSGFSFTSSVAPSVSQTNNYWLAGSEIGNGQIPESPNLLLVEWGRVVAPDFLGTNGGPVGAIPEPATYAMLLAGLGLLGWHARRRKLEAAQV